MRWRHTRLFALGVLVALGNCGGLDNFEIHEDATAVIPGGTLLDQLASDAGFDGFLNMDVDQSQELKNQGVRKNQIDSLKLKQLTLEITQPAGQDFTFLESLEFFIEAAGLPRKRIASGGPFASGATRVELAVDDVELKPYATAESMNVTTQVTGRRPPQETTVKAALTFGVDVDVLGAACGG